MTPMELWELRNRKGVSQRKLARMMGFRRGGTIWQYENGKSRITDRVERMIRDCLESLPDVGLPPSKNTLNNAELFKFAEEWNDENPVVMEEIRIDRRARMGR